jgi:8-oxo-dGTP diphosphatase
MTDTRQNDAVEGSVEPGRPVLAVDVVLLAVVGRELRCLVVQRDDDPFRDCWALPGVALGRDEELSAAATRALHDKVGVDDIFTEQLATFGDVGRDPRSRTISVVHYALVPGDTLPQITRAAAGFAVVEIDWPGEQGGPARLIGADGDELDLAFDHAAMIGLAVLRLRGRLTYSPIAYELLPETFPLREVQRVHEAILGRTVNTDSLRRRLLNSGELVATGRRETGVAARPAELYRYQPTNRSTT